MLVLPLFIVIERSDYSTEISVRHTLRNKLSSKCLYIQECRVIL